MKQPNMMIMSDYYKQGHPEFYPEGLKYLFTCGTARDSRLPFNKMVQFGIQGYAQDYLIERFNETFFDKDKNKAVDEVRRFISETFDCSSFDINRIKDLHDYGKLPVRLWALPEGTVVPIYKQKENPGVVQVPFMAYENTHPEFAWMAEYLESITSAQTWYPIVVATISKFGYRDIVNKHWEKSVIGQPAHTAISEFGFRGCEGSEGGIMASSAFLTSFDKTATCPAVQYMMDYYGKNMTLKEIGSGMSSTEHSVMCSNFGVDGDEDKFMHKLFTKIAPHGNISVVSDSYDYFGRLEAMGKGMLKNDILGRKDGAVYVRGDSGDPIDIICGTGKYTRVDSIFNLGDTMDELDKYGVNGSFYFKILNKDKSKYEYYKIERNKGHNCTPAVQVEPKLEEIGTVEKLFNDYGGHINDKGYIVLNDRVRAIYGDSITPYKAEKIYSRLEESGFAANNVALGAGSFSMQSWEDHLDNNESRLKPYTRDTFGIAFKATYCEVEDKGYQIYKDPKTDSHSFKRSQRGMVQVYRGEDGEIHARDHLSHEEFNDLRDKNMLRPIFEESKMIITDSLRDIRNRLHGDAF